nr:hypothetical protein [Tanacetum cinerariifolium]
ATNILGDLADSTHEHVFTELDRVRFLLGSIEPLVEFSVESLGPQMPPAESQSAPELRTLVDQRLGPGPADVGAAEH